MRQFLEPEPIGNFGVNYIVLGLVLAFERVARTLAFRKFNRVRDSRSIMEEVRRSKDPAVFTVLFEDSAAMLALLVAFSGLLKTQFLGLAWADGAASIGFGVILALAAAGLAYETKSLLTGEAAWPSTLAEMRRLALAEPSVDTLNELRTVHFGPNRILVNISLDFKESSDLAAVEQTVARLERAIRERLPDNAHVFVEAQARERLTESHFGSSGFEDA